MKTYPSIKQSFAITGFVIIGMIISSIVQPMLRNLIGNGAAQLLSYSLGMGIPLLIVHKLRKIKGSTSSYNWSIQDTSLLPLIILCSLALPIGMSMPLVSLIPMPEAVREAFNEAVGQNSVFTFLFLVIAAPLLEEMLFRGVMLKGLLKRYTPLHAILLSSFLFAFYHLNPWQFISAMLLGLLTGWAYYKTRSIGTTAVIHATNNLVGYLITTIAGRESAMSITELYGGLPQTILLICIALLVLITCVYLLNRNWNKETQQAIEQKNLQIKNTL